MFDNTFVERLWRSVKHEDVYLKGYATMGELMVGLTEYFARYNGEHPHQSLGNRTPELVYRTAIGGGAMIVDKFGGAGRGEKPLFRYAPQGFLPPQKPHQKHKPKQRGQRRPAATEVKSPA